VLRRYHESRFQKRTHGVNEFEDVTDSQCNSVRDELTDFAGNTRITEVNRGVTRVFAGTPTGSTGGQTRGHTREATGDTGGPRGTHRENHQRDKQGITEGGPREDQGGNRGGTTGGIKRAHTKEPEVTRGVTEGLQGTREARRCIEGAKLGTIGVTQRIAV